MGSVSPNREELLQSIRPDMKLTRDFFKRIYGYEISFPGFADQAIEGLEVAGCSHARVYYQTWVSDYLAKRDAELRLVVAWYRNELERECRK